MVSDTLSPLEAEEEAASEKPMTLPPKRVMAIQSLSVCGCWARRSRWRGSCRRICGRIWLDPSQCRLPERTACPVPQQRSQVGSSSVSFFHFLISALLFSTQRPYGIGESVLTCVCDIIRIQRFSYDAGRNRVRTKRTAHTLTRKKSKRKNSSTLKLLLIR